MANPLLKRLLGEAETPLETPLEDWQEAALRTIKDRFIRERTEGYTTASGEHVAPIAQEEAIAQWTSAEPRFIKAVREADPEIAARLKGQHERNNTPQSLGRRQEISTASPNNSKKCPHCGGAL